MADVQKSDYELPDNKWLQSHYTYVGNVFDTPEHQAILSKMTNIDDRIAYKEKILNQQHFEEFGEYINYEQ
ncbi:MAG: hypothetical protein K6C94_03410 [Candidatus Gastranaerophilales bacterium]|nr:hypothetical protein [Candidatus Gastranaerophilales bacterium]